MSKEKINIDDLIRQKLNKHPEHTDMEAAWAKMSALLDQEPSKKRPAALLNWKKTALLVGATLFIGILSTKSYEYLSKLNTPTQKSAHSTNTANNTLNNPKNTTTTAINASTNHNHQSDTDETSNHLDKQASIAIKQESFDTQNSASNKAVQQNNKHTTLQQLSSNTLLKQKDLNELSNPATKNLEQEKNALAKINHNNNTATTAANTLKNQNKTDNKSFEAPKTISNKLGKTTGNSSIWNSSNTLPSKVNNNINSTNIVSKTNTSSNQNISKTLNTRAEKTSEIQKSSTTASNHKSTQQQTTKTDSFPTYTVITKQKLSKGFPRNTKIETDTIHSGKIAFSSEEKSTMINIPTKKEESTLIQQKIKTAQQPLLASKQEHKKIQKQKTETATQVSKTSQKEQSKIARWIENLTKVQASSSEDQNLNKGEFYYGFEAGVNKTLSATHSFQGVQFGPTGELVLNKHWSLFGAIKYFNRSGNKQSINDSYFAERANQNPDSISGANWYYKVMTDSTAHYFNFSTLHSFELPISIRYTLNRFYFFTGFNLAYYLGVNVEEVQNTYTSNQSKWVQTNASKPILNHSQAQLKSQDFSSRFGVGYLLGLGYQLAPSWQLDTRLVHTLWDNANGNGSTKISQDFYRNPSIQISVGYQINRNKKKPTFSPTDNSTK